jgi:hypothetical protein
MVPLTSEGLLDAWERGLGRPPQQQALVLLTAACPELPVEAIPRLSIGQRDRRLLRLRESLFGPYLNNTAICPSCGERIEWQNHIADFTDSAAPQEQTPESTGTEHTLDCGGYSVRFRLPDSRDIATAVADVADSGDIATAEQRLLSHCVLAVDHGGESTDSEQLPASVLEALSAELGRLDPLAEIRIRLECADCSHRWDALFDIASFLWNEVNDWAQQMLRCVSALAAGYHWSEQEILELSPVRRQLYLEMLER